MPELYHASSIWVSLDSLFAAAYTYRQLRSEIMKVVEARIYLVEIGTRHPVLVQVFTDEGISGVGEEAIAYGTGANAAAGMIKDLDLRADTF
jgi:hypothetical protein